VGGTVLNASSASKKRKQLLADQERWLPNIPLYHKQYFEDLERYRPEAEELARDIGESDLDLALNLRERATPGITEGLRRSGDSIFSLMRGELPDSVMDAYSRAGGAASVGSGIRGDMNFLNQGLFGARGALGAMEFGYGLLPSFLGAAPNIQVPSSMSFLGQVMTPGARTSTQMAVRGQNLGVSSTAAGMPTSAETWGGFMTGVGGMLMGGGMMGMGGGGMGGGGTGSPSSGGGAPSGGYVAPQANPNWSFNLYG
jgi:hypothetical protein